MGSVGILVFNTDAIGTPTTHTAILLDLQFTMTHSIHHAAYTF